MFKFEASPAFTKNHKIGELAPEAATQFNKKGVCMLLHRVCMPEPVILISDNNLTVHQLLGTVSRLAIWV